MVDFLKVKLGKWVGIGIALWLCSITLVLSQPNFQRAGDDSKIVKRKGQNLVAYDDRFLHYGFFLALNRSAFRTRTAPFFNEQLADSHLHADQKIYAINPRRFVGFTTGFIVNFRLSEFFDARLLPTVAFYQRFVDFRYQNDSIVTELKQSTFSFVELPIMFKYKSVRRNNTRMYMIAGIKPSFEVGSKKKEIQDDRLRAKTFDINIDYGFGFDFYYPLFKFSPEIRFSHGLLNLRNPDPNAYAKSIKKLYTHTITLYFNFE